MGEVMFGYFFINFSTTQNFIKGGPGHIDLPHWITGHKLKSIL